ncbi:MAG: ElyC/SanA/YdcF family protein [Peptococcaceae bacterium]
MFKVALIFIAFVFIIVLTIFLINLYVFVLGKKYTVAPKSLRDTQVAIVLGAYVSLDGQLCDMLKDRVNTAVELYRENKVQKLLLTGDHGFHSYDEVNHMRRYAESQGVPTEDIFLDHAGFNTYDSIYRAKNIFQVESAVVVTQDFHLPRALYIARSLGLKAVGVAADKYRYIGVEQYYLREIPARVKDFFCILAGIGPRFLGEAIPITGDARVTHDQKD